jgi:hypothetical protein
MERHFARQKRQIQTRVISFKDKAFQLHQLRLQYIQLNARLNAARIPRSTKKALLIGINYLGKSNQLYGCINDVNAVQSYLVSKGFTCQSITDQTPLKPTRDNILHSFKQLLMNGIAGDVLVFEFSGHGMYVRDRNRDETDGYDESIVSKDMKYILDDDFKSLLVHLKKDVTLFALFDSCHSGTMLDLKYQYMDDKVHPNTETAGKVYMISGCMDSQTSAEAFIQKKAQGAMTWAWLECIKKNPTWRELLSSMRTLLKKGGYAQIPQFSTSTWVDLDSRIFI